MRIALTIGDPNGVGPETVLKYLASPEREAVEYVVVGERAVLKSYSKTDGIPARALSDSQKVRFDELPLPPFEPVPGLISAQAGRFSMEAVRRAVSLCIDGDVDAVVTAPISKEAIALAGYPYPGHTEFISELTGRDGLMVMVASELRVALMTGHLPVAAVPAAISSSLITARVNAFAASLRADFGIAQPRIAVLALNPHAGDGGVLGTEEMHHYTPAIRQLKEKGLDVTGPYPADGFFGQRGYRDADGVLASFHDQGLVPFKALSFGRGVNFTAGLPIVRTSPDHGTAFDIAGRGEASEASLAAAVTLAAEVVRSRKRQLGAMLT